MHPWTDRDWLAGAHAWIHDRVEDAGAQVTGRIEQPHVEAWSTVLRVPTSAGGRWFKANHPTAAHEAGVVGVLAAARPDLVPALLASDPARGWMLMADGGERLREVVARERRLDRWTDVLPLYGELQLDIAEHADRLVALGTPDRGLATLASEYERLIGETDGLTPDELARLTDLVPEVAEMCRRLAEVGIPETVQHDDLHDGQVFVRNGGYLFFDWGDSCVSHPFFTMSVTLEGVLSWGLDDVEGSVDVTPFRDAYLASFSEYGSRDELEAAHATALRLGWICRAVNMRPFALALQSPAREEWRGPRTATRLRMFLDGSPG
jgi:Phosphotransferase enzyme family